MSSSVTQTATLAPLPPCGRTWTGALRSPSEHFTFGTWFTTLTLALSRSVIVVVLVLRAVETTWFPLLPVPYWCALNALNRTWRCTVGPLVLNVCVPPVIVSPCLTATVVFTVIPANPQLL